MCSMCVAPTSYNGGKKKQISNTFEFREFNHISIPSNILFDDDLSKHTSEQWRIQKKKLAAWQNIECVVR